MQGGIDVDAWRKRIRNDTFSNYHVQMGLALQANGDAAAAIAAFERALTLTPDDPLANHGLVTGLRQLGRDAEAAHRRALACIPDYQFQALLEQARTCIVEKRNGEAARALAEAVALKPDSLEAQTLLEYAEFAEGRRRSAALRPDPIDEALDFERMGILGYPYIRLATGFAQEKRVVETMESFEQALWFQPALAVHMYNVGMIYCAAGHLDRLHAILDTLSRRSDAPPVLWNCLGHTLLALGRLDESMEAHQRALTLDGHNSSATVSIPILLQAMGRFDEAAAWYCRASETAPDDFWLISGRSLLEIATGRPEQGLALQKEVLRRFPSARNFSWLGTNIALVERSNGLHDAATASHRQAIAGEPHLLGFHARMRPWALAELTAAYDTLRFDPADLRHVAAAVQTF